MTAIEASANANSADDELEESPVDVVIGIGFSKDLVANGGKL